MSAFDAKEIYLFSPQHIARVSLSCRHQVNEKFRKIDFDAVLAALQKLSQSCNPNVIQEILIASQRQICVAIRKAGLGRVALA